MQKEQNLAYIDGQNLYLGTQSDWRSVDLKKFRVYLRDKFHVEEAYYFLWFISEDEQDLYNTLQRAGFIVVFREHSSALKGKKKWNVDVDIVLEMMKKIADDRDSFDKIVLISWDGDYIKIVRYLIQKNLLKKVIFPNSNHSSLYKKLSNKFYYYLSAARKKIEYFKKTKQ